MTQKFRPSTAFGLLFAGCVGYLVYRFFRIAEAELSPEIAAKLPISKNLNTIPDQVGNYDMDGVSFDVEGVIISSDSHKTIIAPI
jgi:hypothetical protein